MLRFDCVIETAPLPRRYQEAIELDGVRVVPIAKGADQSAPWGVTFDDAGEQLATIERLYFEPDGSIVWAKEDEAGQRWQVDGNLCDRGPELGYVQLMGRCPAAAFEQLLSVLGWPEAPLVFQLPRAGVVLEYGEFMKWARREG